ncbi:hypothetical protein Clacol_006775 [Clathrus columnatus]|uniref:DUF3835 domain-containing protein n=1 Tax=Clathrus columnatus TaxID=1419009 RepID=A0AAV5AFM3_9AGAM|nr:hypothetical protein Clacol_006775 [Clathrus columnatus]
MSPESSPAPMTKGETKELSQLNEEGLPIVEIIEPVPDDLDTPSLTAATDEYEYIEDHYLEPLSNLSPEALALNRQRRDKILQMLEEEEERETRRTEQERRLELQRQRELARKQMEIRMLNQGFEIEKRRKAKEVELRMAKALVTSKSEDTELESTTTHNQKKTVTFVEPHEDFPKTTSQSLSSSSKKPMKMTVIERTPVSMPVSGPSSAEKPSFAREKAASSRSIKFIDSGRDSDDELEPDNDTNSTASMESFDEDIVLSAKLHRELALEYHTRREALASRGVDLSSQEKTKKTDWDQEDVPLEATLAKQPPKPSMSRFKGVDLTTFGTAVLPPETLSNSVRMGKLVNGQLVASPLDEEKEDEEMEEETIRKLLLRSMDQYAGIASQVLGPSSNGSYWPQSEDSSAATTHSISKGQAGVNLKPPKTSHFKYNRTQSRPATVHSSVETAPELSETPLVGNPTFTSKHTSTIINSPSFPGSNPSSIADPPFFSSVIDSTSFSQAFPGASSDKKTGPAVFSKSSRLSPMKGPVGDVLERSPMAVETRLESDRKSRKPSRFSMDRA